jgi:DNA-binding response OmpR family regulator
METGWNKMSDAATILLIDDDADFVEATRAVLESVPYQVLVAYGGDDGLAKARETQPNLVILDVFLPVKDGFQILKELKSDPALASVPVMLLTALSNGIMSPANELAIEIADYIDKPIRPTELLQRVEKLLGK